MTSEPDARPEGGPRYATLLEQMDAWQRDLIAKNQPPKPPTSAERRVPPPQA